jgi:sorbitol/mannitol transport system permease protein
MKRLSPTLLTPAVVAVSVISVIPLLITLYYSFVRYSMLDPSGHPFHG